MANGEDYNNIFSGDYWSPDGYRKRKEGERKAASTLAQKQNQATQNQWRGIGDFIGTTKLFDGIKTPYQQRQENKTAVSRTSTSAPAYRSGPSDLEREKLAASPANNVIFNNKMLSDESDRSRSGAMDVDPKQSLFDELLGKITSSWGGVDKSKIDYSPLDAALNSKLGALNKLRENTNQNYDKSDVALEGMHKALQNQMGTEGAARYNQISDTEKNNLTASNQQAQNYLQGIKDQDLAKRQAMLQNLGLPANELDVKPDEVLSQAQASIASRNDANVTNAEADRGTNLAFNQGVINSVGQAGVERRADLQNQLQSILGRLGMAEADAQSENAQARYQLEQNAGDKQYQQWRDEKGFLGDTLGMMQQDERERQKMMLEAQNQKPSSVSGFAGLGQDLLNTGYDPREVQHAMGILAQQTSSDDYLKDTNSMTGNDKVSVINRILQRNGVTNPMLALQLATNYANLGNVSKYEQSPY